MTDKELHNKEPWVIHKETDSVECAIAADGWFIAICCDGADKGQANADDNARRIVACVNACAGIPTEMLEAGNGVADAVRHFQNQRDELLAALKLARAELDKLPHSLGYDFDHIPAIDAAIAKCES